MFIATLVLTVRNGATFCFVECGETEELATSFVFSLDGEQLTNLATALDLDEATLEQFSECAWRGSTAEFSQKLVDLGVDVSLFINVIQ